MRGLHFEIEASHWLIGFAIERMSERQNCFFGGLTKHRRVENGNKKPFVSAEFIIRVLDPENDPKLCLGFMLQDLR